MSSRACYDMLVKSLVNQDVANVSRTVFEAQNGTRYMVERKVDGDSWTFIQCYSVGPLGEEPTIICDAYPDGALVLYQAALDHSEYFFRDKLFTVLQTYYHRTVVNNDTRRALYRRRHNDHGLVPRFASREFRDTITERFGIHAEMSTL